MEGAAPLPTVSDADWAYACTLALRTQDCVQRNLLEIISHLTGRPLPRFPAAQASAAPNPQPKKPA